jgi:hypothetical protein
MGIAGLRLCCNRESPLHERIVMAIRTLQNTSTAGSSASPAHPKPAPGQNGRAGTTRLTVSLSTELVERLRDTVFGMSQGTLSGLVARAIEDAICRVEAHYGGWFPRRTHELKAGRPRKKAPAAVSMTLFRSKAPVTAASPHPAGLLFCEPIEPIEPVGLRHKRSGRE